MLPRINLDKVVAPSGSQKASFYELFGGGSLQYSQFGRIYLNGQKGTFYKLFGGSFYKDALTLEEQINYLTSYNNVTFFDTSPAYAPEMKSVSLFLADKAIN